MKINSRREKMKPKKLKTKSKKKYSKKGALIKGYLEKKDRISFDKLLPRYRDVIGNSSGIYALYKGKKLYYVGIALNLLNRVANHLNDKHSKKWDNVSFFIIDKHKFSKDIETVILRIAEPIGNGTKGKFRKHYELSDKLKRIKKEMKDLVKRV